MVRDALGEDAIIVATREEKGGKAVRVTAAVDPSDYDDRSYGEAAFNEYSTEYNERPNATMPNFETHDRTQASSADSWLQYDDEQDENAVAEEITDAMLRHAVPEDVMDQILSCATVVGFEEPSVAMIAAIEHLFQFKPLPQTAAVKPMIFVGPPGSGKTLAVAKTAARATMNGLNVGVISTDIVRAGGFEQLAAFTKLLRIDLLKAETPAQLSSKIQSLKGCDQIIIDTAGMNPFNTDDVKKLARLIGADNLEPYLVLPGGMDAEESGEMGRVFSTIGVNNPIPARLDMARRLGGILSAAHHGAMNFTDASNTPKVADGLTSLNPKILSKMLMPNAFRAHTNAGPNSGRRTGTQ